MEEVSHAIVAALFAEGPEGRRYDDAVLRDAVPVLLLSIADQVDVEALPDALLQMVDAFLERAEANRSADPAEVTAAVERYLEKHPLPGSLWQQVEGILLRHDAALDGDVLERVRAFSRFSDAPLRAPGVDDAAPEGSSRGGLLLRAKFAKKKDSKK